MKWGVRRYQKEDGTLTNAGKKRYSDDGMVGSSVGERLFEPSIKSGKDKPLVSPAEKIAKETEKSINEATKISNTISKMRKDRASVSELTNEELKSAIERMRLEDSYEELDQKRLERGRKSVSDFLAIAGGITAIAASAAGIASTIVDLKRKG